MTNVGIPLFDLKASNDYLFIAGGGGSKEYGKENGIMAVKKSSKTLKVDHFYKTSDFIVYLQLYSETPEEACHPPEISLEEAPATADGFESTSNEEFTASDGGLSEESYLINRDERDLTNNNERDLINNNERDLINRNERDLTNRNERDLEANLEANSEGDLEANLEADSQGDPFIKKHSSPKNEIYLSHKKTRSNKIHTSPKPQISLEEHQRCLLEKQNRMVPRKPSKGLFILAVGDDNLYILRFTGTFSLHCKYDRRIRAAFLNRHLILSISEKLNGYYDIIKNPSALNFQVLEIGENVKDPTEEYVYKLYKRRSEVIPLNEHLTRDIPKDWEDFFVFGNKVHKIIRGGSMSQGLFSQLNTFVFKNQKYEIIGKMSKVLQTNGGLVFYSNTEKEGFLYFMGLERKVFKLPRITAFDVQGDLTVVATLPGNAVVYHESRYLQRMGLGHVPVTGISIDKSRIYFSQLDGVVDWKRRVSNIEKAYRFISLLVLILAILIYLIIRSKK